jgi:uncharacterized membrane-anchored protein YitT (DUF2179 family)
MLISATKIINFGVNEFHSVRGVSLRFFLTLKLPKKLDISLGIFLFCVDFGFLCGFLMSFISLSRNLSSFLSVWVKNKFLNKKI